MTYASSEKKFREQMAQQSAAVRLPSYGVHDIIMTPLLSSIYMQKSPSMLIAFLSFNEQLIRASLSDCNPMRVLLINGVPPHLHWREKAMSQLHEQIIKEYNAENTIDSDGKLNRKASTLDYTESFELLAQIYHENCVYNRIILAPTGSKLQALSCALMRLCCSDIHIEYPTPESYFVPGYSSVNIRDIHQVVFDKFAEAIRAITLRYALDR